MEQTELIEAATTAVQTAFEELCQTPVVPGEPSAIVAEDVIAAIMLKRDPPGELLLAFPVAVLEVLAARYLPDEPLAADMLHDTAGEFANVIAGQMKTMLKGTPWHFDLSTPRIGSRENDVPATVAIAFECDAGAFNLEIRM